MSRWALVCAVCAACKYDAPSAPVIDPDAADAPVDAVVVDVRTDAWLKPWNKRKAFTLRASKVHAPNNLALDDFPVLVSVTDLEIAASALASGDDIVFTAGDAVTKLATEIERFTPQGELVAWVKIPSLSATVDTPLYIYYGNPAAPAPAPEAVWTAQYQAVWHFAQDLGVDVAGSILDATAGNHDGTANSSMTATSSVPTQIGHGFAFDGASDFIDFPTSMGFGNSFTISMWLNLNGASTSGIKTLLSTTITGSNQDGFRLFVNQNATADHSVVIETGNGSGSNSAFTAPAAIVPDTWAHVAVIVDHQAGNAVFLVNGTINTMDSGILNDFQTTNDFEIGRMKNGLRFHGMLDEVEIASTLRPLEWIQTEASNQSDPAGFRTAFAVEEHF